MPGICCMCIQRPNLRKTVNPCKLRCHSFCVAAYVSTLCCCPQHLPVCITVLFWKALHLGEICIVQPMASEVSATTLSTYLFLSDLFVCGVLQEACTVAHLRVQDTTFANIALHIFQGLSAVFCCLESLHSKSCMITHQCLGANASLPPGLCLY